MTARQFYLTLFIFSVSLRVQKMPALLSSNLGKDSYLLILFFFAVDLVGILLAFFVLKFLKNKPKQEKSAIYNIVKSIILIFVALYFMLQCLLMYEAIQDLFSHVLFDNLPWTLFSLLLIATLFYLAYTGLRGIGRVIEIYFFIIVVSYGIISIFGGMQTNFSAILPFETIDFGKICDNFVKFNLWFGDFFLILFLGKHSKGIKLKWTLLTYVVAMSLVVLLTIEFYGMYSIYSPMQPSLISVLSEQSMLGVDVGRVDWFLILFTEMGTIICSALCLYFAKQCLSEALPKIKGTYFLLALVILLYLVDVIYLVDTNVKEIVFLGFSSYFSLILKVTVFLFVFFMCLIKSKRNKSENQLLARQR